MRVAFLFDNDGVLIDSSQLHWESWQLFMQEEPNFHMDHAFFKESFGKRNDLILQELVPHVSETTRHQWAQRKETLFRRCAKGKVTLIEGMELFLQSVVDAHIPHIIASSTPIENLEMFLHYTILGTYFEHYLSAEQVAHGKPAPDIFVAAAKHLGYAPNECVVFEDAPAGIAAGKAAGCFVVALATTHQKEYLKDYDMIYPSPQALDLQDILNAFSRWRENA